MTMRKNCNIQFFSSDMKSKEEPKKQKINTTREQLYLYDFVGAGYKPFGLQLFHPEQMTHFIAIFGGRFSLKSENGYYYMMLRLEKELNGNAVVFRKYSNIHADSSVGTINDLIDELSPYFPNMRNWEYKVHRSAFIRKNVLTGNTQEIRLRGVITGGDSKIKSLKFNDGYLAVCLGDEVQEPSDIGKPKNDDHVLQEIKMFDRITKSIFRRRPKGRDAPIPQFILITNNEMHESFMYDVFWDKYVESDVNTMLKKGEGGKVVESFKTLSYRDPKTNKPITLRLKALVGHTCYRLLGENDNLDLLSPIDRVQLEEQRINAYDRGLNEDMGFKPILKNIRFSKSVQSILEGKYNKKETIDLIPYCISMDWGKGDNTAISLGATTGVERNGQIEPSFQKIGNLENKSFAGSTKTLSLDESEKFIKRVCYEIIKEIYQGKKKYINVGNHLPLNFLIPHDAYYIRPFFKKAIKQFEDDEGLYEEFTFIKFEKNIGQNQKNKQNPRRYKIVAAFMEDELMVINTFADKTGVKNFTKLVFDEKNDKIRELNKGQDEIDAAVYGILPATDHILIKVDGEN